MNNDLNIARPLLAVLTSIVFVAAVAAIWMQQQEIASLNQLIVAQSELIVAQDAWIETILPSDEFTTTTTQRPTKPEKDPDSSLYDGSGSVSPPVTYEPAPAPPITDSPDSPFYGPEGEEWVFEEQFNLLDDGHTYFADTTGWSSLAGWEDTVEVADGPFGSLLRFQLCSVEDAELVYGDLLLTTAIVDPGYQVILGTTVDKVDSWFYIELAIANRDVNTSLIATISPSLLACASGTVGSGESA